MALLIREVMTTDPIVLQKDSTVAEAAMAMKGRDIGDVLVADGENLCGIVTDRDIVVRVLAEGKDAKGTKLGEVCSQDLVTVGPDGTVDDAVRAVRDKAIRRLPVAENGRPVGILSLGDLAVERDPDSALAEVSAAPPNE